MGDTAAVQSINERTAANTPRLRENQRLMTVVAEERDRKNQKGKGGRGKQENKGTIAKGQKSPIVLKNKSSDPAAG